jgi:hypothetical protein
LLDILVIALCAVIAGSNTWQEVGWCLTNIVASPALSYAGGSVMATA